MNTKQRSCKYVYLFVYERSKSGDGNMHVYFEISWYYCLLAEFNSG